MLLMLLFSFFLLPKKTLAEHYCDHLIKQIKTNYFYDKGKIFIESCSAHHGMPLVHKKNAEYYVKIKKYPEAINELSLNIHKTKEPSMKAEAYIILMKSYILGKKIHNALLTSTELEMLLAKIKKNETMSHQNIRKIEAERLLLKAQALSLQKDYTAADETFFYLKNDLKKNLTDENYQDAIVLENNISLKICLNENTLTPNESEELFIEKNTKKIRCLNTSILKIQQESTLLLPKTINMICQNIENFILDIKKNLYNKNRTKEITHYLIQKNKKNFFALAEIFSHEPFNNKESLTCKKNIEHLKKLH